MKINHSLKLSIIQAVLHNLNGNVQKCTTILVIKAFFSAVPIGSVGVGMQISDFVLKI